MIRQSMVLDTMELKHMFNTKEQQQNIALQLLLSYERLYGCIILLKCTYPNIVGISRYMPTVFGYINA